MMSIFILSTLPIITSGDDHLSKIHYSSHCGATADTLKAQMCRDGRHIEG